MGAGFPTGISALGGLAEGFGQAYNQAHQNKLNRDLDLRHQLAGAYTQMFQNARPEAQGEIFNRVVGIYSAPMGKPLPKNLTDMSSLFQPPPGTGGQPGQPGGLQNQSLPGMPTGGAQGMSSPGATPGTPTPV